MLIDIIIGLLLGGVAFFIPAWFTGNAEHGGIESKDDERAQFIKSKAITGSWIFMLIFFIFMSISGFFGLSINIPFVYEHQSLFYLTLLIISYFVYYLIYSRRLSGDAK